MSSLPRWAVALAVPALLLAAAAAGPALGQAPPPAEAPADQPQKPRRLTGVEAWNTLIGNSATGRTKEGTRTDYYAPDGTIKTLIGSELKTGKWRLDGEKVCLEYPQSDEDDDDEDDETCYKVTITGNYVIFLDDDGEGWRLRIVPGNPKDL